MLTLGIVGYGYWGPNIVRNFMGLADVNVSKLCDANPAALQRAGNLYPHIAMCTEDSDITADRDIDAVAIVTPVFTHYPLTKAALENGKHVFVEKPFTSTIGQAEELIELADRKNRLIMVDHTFLFTGAVRRIKEIIDRGDLGDLRYYDSTRINLGLFQHDINVIWDLAPHDFSILDYLSPNKAVAVCATGHDHFRTGMENIGYVTIYLEGNMIAHFNMNWLSPVKIRSTLIGGTKKMLVWDDLKPDEKIKVYDTGVEVEGKENIYNLLVSYRTGDMWSPKVDHVEALRLEAQYFVDCIRKNEKPVNDGQAGLRIVRMLVATSRSLREGSRQVAL